MVPGAADLTWLQAIATQRLLPVWFALWSTQHAIQIGNWGAYGGDAVIYHRAAVAFANGGDPWAAHVVAGTSSVFHFYALPPTVILLQPLVLVPESWIQPFGVGLQALAAIYVVRRLRLAWWWLLFPPLVSGVLSGNPSITLLAALLTAQPAVKAIAPLLKVYAVLPILLERPDRRNRALLITAGAVLLTVVSWPGLWAQFLTGMGAREAQLMHESAGGFSAYQYGLGVTVLVAIALTILAFVDRRAAGWLAPIAIWPASQFHWSTLAMPLRSPWLAAGLAINVQGAPVLAVLGYVLWRVLLDLKQAAPVDLIAGSPGDRGIVGQDPRVGAVGDVRLADGGSIGDHLPDADEVGRA